MLSISGEGCESSRAVDEGDGGGGRGGEGGESEGEPACDDDDDDDDDDDGDDDERGQGKGDENDGELKHNMCFDKHIEITDCDIKSLYQITLRWDENKNT